MIKSATRIGQMCEECGAPADFWVVRYGDITDGPNPIRGERSFYHCLAHVPQDVLDLWNDTLEDAFGPNCSKVTK